MPKSKDEPETIGQLIEHDIPNVGDVTYREGYRIEHVADYKLTPDDLKHLPGPVEET